MIILVINHAGESSKEVPFSANAVSFSRYYLICLHSVN